MKKVYMQVTHDEYELPIAVADSATELADMLGTTKASILSAISHYNHQGKYSTFRAVEIEEETDGLQDITRTKKDK